MLIFAIWRTIMVESLLVGAVLFGASLPLHAQNQQDYCISCRNPDQSYVCRITSSSGGSTQGKQLLCIMNIAREKGHDSCAASAQTQDCSGVLVQYEVGAEQPGEEGSSREVLAPHIAPPVLRPKAKREPRTLVEFTKQTTKSTKKEFKSVSRKTSKAFKKTGRKISKFTHKTGRKISKFTKKVGKNISKLSKTSWRCLTSLFTACGAH